jgi:hypothetical protein
MSTHLLLDLVNHTLMSIPYLLMIKRRNVYTILVIGKENLSEIGVGFRPVCTLLDDLDTEALDLVHHELRSGGGHNDSGGGREGESGMHACETGIPA